VPYVQREQVHAHRRRMGIEMRPSKDNYYLGLAEAAAKRSTCIRRQYGAVIVKHNKRDPGSWFVEYGDADAEYAKNHEMALFAD